MFESTWSVDDIFLILARLSHLFFHVELMNVPCMHAIYCAQDGPAPHLADRYTCGHLEAQCVDLFTFLELGNGDEKVDGLTAVW